MTRFWNRHPKVDKEISERLSQATSDKEYLEKQKCPKCDATKLRSLSVEHGREGWEIKFWCDNCKSNGTINHTGFHVELTERSLEQK